MRYLRRRYRQKPRQWGPISDARTSVFDWFNRHGMSAPNLLIPFWEGSGDIRFLGRYQKDGGIDVGNSIWTNLGLHFDKESSPIITLGAEEVHRFRTPFTFFVRAKADSSTPADYDYSWFNKYNTVNGSVAINIGPWATAGAYPVIATKDATWVTHQSNSELEIETYSTVVFVYDGTNLHFYIDGVLDKSMAYTLPADAASDNNTIGGNSSGNYWDGDIEIMMILDEAISADNVALLHDQPFSMLKPRFVPFYSFAAGGTTLAVADSVSAGSLDAPTLTQKHNLAVSDLASGNSLDAVVLTQKAQSDHNRAA